MRSSRRIGFQPAQQSVHVEKLPLQLDPQHDRLVRANVSRWVAIQCGQPEWKTADSTEHVLHPFFGVPLFWQTFGKTLVLGPQVFDIG